MTTTGKTIVARNSSVSLNRIDFRIASPLRPTSVFTLFYRFAVVSITAVFSACRERSAALRT
ncbi:hypothetical protein SD70_10345 [Gordoniibacillus kamchatkensis]|uniref:Uncharacterized protein n=1 Tax=Gordoniibacillus kamchatkensis TaxID=1590651 RepID=A0ABR5AJ54_9BACL|nr:hypothetical protein [Paenibacillus sp. VKM B-2647]KIL41001.1 hypothetical protein SD70_10345 [Paenibacillus sp. VKM B-2647]